MEKNDAASAMQSLPRLRGRSMGGVEKALSIYVAWRFHLKRWIADDIAEEAMCQFRSWLSGELDTDLDNLILPFAIAGKKKFS